MSTLPIIHTDMTVKFRDQKQARKFVGLLTKDGRLNFTYEMVLLEMHEEYHVHLHDVAWADNIVWMAKFLRNIDYKG